MLEAMWQRLDQPGSGRDLCAAWDRASAWLALPQPHGDREQVARLERLARRQPDQAFQPQPDGTALLVSPEGQFAAGRFACRSSGQLQRALQPGTEGLRLWLLEGTAPVTDIGALQALAAPGSLFQVASQFNCLESPGPYLAEVADYFFDPTQGPRASISCFPGTLLRHYAAPDGQGNTFTQSAERQLNLLHRVALPGVARVHSGYLLADEVEQLDDFLTLLEEHFQELEVGVHEQLQVVLGAGWDGPVPGSPRIAQVFTSTLAAGGYSRVDLSDTRWLKVLRRLQRAAYLGTLLAAAATGQRRAVLTLIGGGVFANPLPLIWDSILWACDQLSGRLATPLTVVVNGRNLSETLPLEGLRDDCERRGGGVLTLGASGASLNR